MLGTTGVVVRNIVGVVFCRSIGGVGGMISGWDDRLYLTSFTTMYVSFASMGRGDLKEQPDIL